MKKRERILRLLAISTRPLSAPEIHNIVGGFWLPYAILFDLEDKGLVKVTVLDGPYPRKHVYSLKGSSNGQG